MIIVYEFYSGKIDEKEISGYINDFEESGQKEAAATMCFYLGSFKSLQGDETAGREWFLRGTRESLHTVSEYLSMQGALRPPH